MGEDSVTHPYDVACPYCVRQAAVEIGEEKKTDRQKEKELAERRAIRETRTILEPDNRMEAKAEELPPWAKMEDQPEHLRPFLRQPGESRDNPPPHPR